MAFFYIELDGKTVTKFENGVEFQAVKQDEVTEKKHLKRIFAVHPAGSRYISKDTITGRYVYTYEGKRTEY